MTDRLLSDLGTPERAKRNRLKAELTGKGYAVRMRVVDGSELDKLLYSGKLSDLEHSACTAFACDCHAARLLGVKTARFEVESVQTRTVPERIAYAFRKVNEAIRAMDTAVGVRPRQMFVALVLEDRAIPEEKMPQLKAAITALEKFYDEWRGFRKASLAEEIAHADL